MGIDGIRKSSPPASSPADSANVGNATRAPEANRAFETQRATAPADVGATEPLRGPLAALQTGAVDLNGYLDLKVNEATAHLVGLPAPELLSIRAAIRERLAADPTLVDLVRTAAGGTPPARVDP